MLIVLHNFKPISIIFFTAYYLRNYKLPQLLTQSSTTLSLKQFSEVNQLHFIFYDYNFQDLG